MDLLERIIDSPNCRSDSSDISVFPSVTISGNRKAGLGECLPELPEGGQPAKTTSPENDLQAEDSSLPDENRIGTQVDTTSKNCGSE